MNTIEIIRTEKKENTYKLGQMFLTPQYELLMLARVKENDIVLIGVKDGNRWRSPVSVSDSNNITEQDMKACCTDFYSLTPVDVKITVTL